MAQTPQPGFLSAWVAAFGSFDEAHGFAVNLFVVCALSVLGAAFLSGRPWLIRPALIGFAALCLADWVLVEDLGFLGGLGTDPNSMIPFILLASGGYLALTRPTPLTADADPAAPSAAAPASAAARALSAFLFSRTAVVRAPDPARRCRRQLTPAIRVTVIQVARPRLGSWRTGRRNPSFIGV